MHGLSSPTGNPRDRHSLQNNDREEQPSSGVDNVFPAERVPQPTHMHGMHAGCGDTLNTCSSPQNTRFIPSVVSWLQGVWPQARMHEHHAQVPASEDIATHMKARYDMHTPMHLVLWHMLGDCRDLLVNAFSVGNCGRKAQRHAQHALYQAHSNNDTDTHGELVEGAALSQQQSHAEPPATVALEIGGGSFALTAERRAVRIAVVLAFFNQISASTSIINYAPVVLKHVGVSTSAVAMELAAVVSCCKTVGIIVGILLIDRAGRRLLLLSGSVGCAVSMFSLAAAVWLMSPLWTVVSMCSYILLFSTCWAGVFWVICAEIFSMSIKSPGMALATASLFLSGAVTDIMFPMLLSGLQGGAFVIFGVLAALGGVYVFSAVPETKGLSLLEVQAALQWRRTTAYGSA